MASRRLAPPLNAIVREDVEEGAVNLLELPSFLYVDFDASITRGGSGDGDPLTTSGMSSSLVNSVTVAKARATEPESNNKGRIVWAENVRTRQLVPVRLKPGAKNDEALENEDGGERGGQEQESENAQLLPPDLGTNTIAEQQSALSKRHDVLATHVNVVVLMRVCFFFFQVSPLSTYSAIYF